MLRADESSSFEIAPFEKFFQNISAHCVRGKRENSNWCTVRENDL